MANITLSELNHAGVELFQDSESFFSELKDVDAISGGSYGYGGGGSYVSDMSFLTKLAEVFVGTYAIGHITYLAKSISSGW
ncbi:hypothetical protein [Nodularia chucula]|uniref:hypothetical protein n=1 Tax=Nodularia chucula TaxID=3093667 RepID=UPI0039C5B287